MSAISRDFGPMFQNLAASIILKCRGSICFECMIILWTISTVENNWLRDQMTSDVTHCFNKRTVKMTNCFYSLSIIIRTPTIKQAARCSKDDITRKAFARTMVVLLRLIVVWLSVVLPVVTFVVTPSVRLLETVVIGGFTVARGGKTFLAYWPLFPAGEYLITNTHFLSLRWTQAAPMFLVLFQTN